MKFDREDDEASQRLFYSGQFGTISGHLSEQVTREGVTDRREEIEGERDTDTRYEPNQNLPIDNKLPSTVFREQSKSQQSVDIKEDIKTGRNSIYDRIL